MWTIGVGEPIATCPAAATCRAAGRHRHLTTTERVLACWFMVTGCIHFVIEGWVVAKADFYQDASGNYLSDTCQSVGRSVGWKGLPGSRSANAVRALHCSASAF